MIVTLLAVKLVNKEDNRLLQLLRIAEMVLCAYFRAILTINKEHAGVCHLQCCQGSSYEVVTSRTVNHVQFLVVPLYIIYSREDRITILLLYREVVRNCVLLCNATTSADNTCFIKKAFCQSGLTRSVIA